MEWRIVIGRGGLSWMRKFKVVFVLEGAGVESLLLVKLNFGKSVRRT